MDIEDVAEDQILRRTLDVRELVIPSEAEESLEVGVKGFLHSLRSVGMTDKVVMLVQNLWNCFINEDARVVEINPLVKTADGQWYAADAKVALDDDAFYRHPEWKVLEPRTSLPRPPTEREIAAAKIDEGEAYYRGTASKYIELDGDIAILFSGGGASIANMDALIKAGGKPANYTEYSGNPPREKVAALAKVVLSKPGLKGLWIAGGVANFTNVADTFQGIVDALDELKPSYPIVVRRAGPHEEEGMRIMKECGERNGLTMKLFGKETSMSETAGVLMGMVGD
jgi:citryl-CoA synthetase large subunit